MSMVMSDTRDPRPNASTLTPALPPTASRLPLQGRGGKTSLDLAIRSTRLLGFASAGYGVFFVFAYGWFNRYERYQLFFIAFGMILFVLPGVAFIVQAQQMEQQRRRGAAVGAMVVAVLQGICAAGLFVANFFFTPISVIPVVLSFVWVIAIGQMVFHLRRSLPLMEIDAEKRHGFEIATEDPGLRLRSDAGVEVQSTDSLREK